jgi:hypothetical protein
MLGVWYSGVTRALLLVLRAKLALTNTYLYSEATSCVDAVREGPLP